MKLSVNRATYARRQLNRPEVYSEPFEFISGRASTRARALFAFPAKPTNGSHLQPQVFARVYADKPQHINASAPAATMTAVRTVVFLFCFSLQKNQCRRRHYVATGAAVSGISSSSACTAQQISIRQQQMRTPFVG